MDTIEDSYINYIETTRTRLKELPSIKTRIYSLMTFNRDIIELSGRATCLTCSSETSFEDIQEWTDLNTTGICPHCGVDTLFPIITNDTLNSSYSIPE